MSDLALVPRRVLVGRPRHHHADRSRPLLPSGSSPSVLPTPRVACRRPGAGRALLL